MTKDDVFRAALDNLQQRIRTGGVAQMPAIAQYTLLQALVVMVVVAEHIGVMVAFQQHQGAARHRVADAARKMAEVRRRRNAESPAPQPIADRVSRVMRDGERHDADIADIEIRERIERSAEFRGDFADLCVHRVPRHFGGIDGDFMLPAQHTRAGDMVNMFVGDENGVNGVAINANHIQCFINHFARLSGVDEQAGCAILHEEAVAARTGVEGAENHFHWIPFWIPVLTFFSAFFSRVQPKGTLTEKTSDKNQLT